MGVILVNVVNVVIVVIVVVGFVGTLQDGGRQVGASHNQVFVRLPPSTGGGGHGTKACFVACSEHANHVNRMDVWTRCPRQI